MYNKEKKKEDLNKKKWQREYSRNLMEFVWCM